MFSIAQSVQDPRLRALLSRINFDEEFNSVAITGFYGYSLTVGLISTNRYLVVPGLTRYPLKQAVDTDMIDFIAVFNGPRLGGRGDDELGYLYEIIPDGNALSRRSDVSG